MKIRSGFGLMSIEDSEDEDQPLWAMGSSTTATQEPIDWRYLPYRQSMIQGYAIM